MYTPRCKAAARLGLKAVSVSNTLCAVMQEESSVLSWPINVTVVVSDMCLDP